MLPTVTQQDTSTYTPTRRVPVLSDLYIAIVTPMANEGDEGVRFVKAALAQTEGFGRVTMFVLIDRATKDNSLELLQEYAREDPRLEVIWAPETRGLVDAYLRSYRVALDSGADWILEMDAGFSHDPADMPKFWQAIESGCECAFGTRFGKGGRIEDSSFKRISRSSRLWRMRATKACVS